MKRSLVATATFGLVCAVIVGMFHVSGLLLRWEGLIAELIFRQAPAPQVLSDAWQFCILALLGLAMAWAAIEITQPFRRLFIYLFLSLQLISVAWVLGLYKVLFQPLPSLLVVTLTMLAGSIFSLTSIGRRKRLAQGLFGHRLSRQKFHALVDSKIPLEFAGRKVEATVVVCDLANQDDLAAELPGENYAGVVDAFIRCSTELFLQEGAYLDAGDGEGVRAIFGLPMPDAQHAVRAAAAALKLLQKLTEWKRQDNQFFGKIDARIGISSGAVLASSVTSGRRAGFLVTGEALELARRFCVANRVYGSRILAGPKTFELAGKSIVARPLDFLPGRESRERFEIYEVLSLVAEASPDALVRRDCFWRGVVFYRSERYNEAFAEFEKARGEGADLALQWYLRKMEALRLHLADRQENAWVGEPLSPL